MHPNPAFRQASEKRNLQFARDTGFGALAVNGADGPLLSHVPFLLGDDGTTAELHLVRSNPIARLDGVAAVLSIVGPQGYISPDWYGVADQVPTWNYVAVHLRGRLVALSSETLPDMLKRLSAHFEARLAPKPPWTMDKMTDGVGERMMRQILPFRLEITGVSGTWKVSQNKPDPVRQTAATAVQDAELAELMRSPPQNDPT